MSQISEDHPLRTESDHIPPAHVRLQPRDYRFEITRRGRKPSTSRFRNETIELWRIPAPRATSMLNGIDGSIGHLCRSRCLVPGPNTARVKPIGEQQQRLV